MRLFEQGARLLARSLWLMKQLQVAGNVAGCSHAVLGLPLEMSTVNKENTVHGLPVQSRVAAAYRAVPTARAMILAHMVMNGG